MTSAKHLIAMIRSHAVGDDERFLTIAEHIAEDAVRSGRNRVAEDIRNVVAAARQAGMTITQPAVTMGPPIPIVAPRGELAGLVHARYPHVRMDDLVLSDRLREACNRLVLEHEMSSRLHAFGLEPRRKLLLHGPPGTGKSFTAAALAGQMGLPLFTVLLDGVISKFMGETAAKLRIVFDAMQATRGVYLFDEIDALAANRGEGNDIGEARRVVNSFLQFLQDDASGSIVVATTNHGRLLDPAVVRRFDAVLAFERPTARQAIDILRSGLVDFGADVVDWTSVAGSVDGLSQAELVATVRDVARDAVVDGVESVTTDRLLGRLDTRRPIHGY